MNQLFQPIACLSLSVKFACAVLGLLVIHAAFRLLGNTLPRHFARADARYRVRKFVVFVGGPVFNYSQGFRFVWDEIKVPLTAQSDHRLAREMLLRVAEETVAHFLAEAQLAWKRVTENYRIENPRLEPTVALAVSGACLEFTVSYIVDYTERTVMKDRLFTKIAEEISSSDGRIDWAFSSTAASMASER